MNESNEPERAPRSTVSRHAALIKLGVASLVVLLLMAGFKGYRDLTYVKSQEAALQLEIDAHRERIEVLKSRIERIKKDPGSLEQIAREELAWVRDGDVVIILPEAKGKAPSPSR